MNYERSQVLDKRQVQMIKKLLKQGLNKTEVARRLGISRETVRNVERSSTDIESFKGCCQTILLKKL